MMVEPLITHRIRRILRRFSLDLVPYNLQHPDRALFDHVKECGITTAFDVGANRGQFASRLLRYGFLGTIHSFEPLPSAYTVLAERAAKRGRWHTHAFALGRENREMVLHVGANDQTSSLLIPLSERLSLAPDMRLIGEERVLVRRMDDVVAELAITPERLFLKLDVQGAERAVLEGGPESLRSIPLLQLETSLSPLYNGEATTFELINLLERRGFRLASLVPGYVDPKCRIMHQVDLILFRPR